MAYAGWLSVSPTSGSGNGSVGVSTAAHHTGRGTRNTTVTFKASGVADKTVTVNQAGKPEFVEFESTKAAAKAGGNITITGTSNSTKLNFTLGTGDLAITLPVSYTANSVSTNNNVAISGDPGNTAEYAFSIQITVPANTGVTSLTKQVTVTDNGGNNKTCTITQAAGDPALAVSPATINLTYQGASQNITVTSNTSWTVE